MSAHLVYEDFFGFLEALASERGDPWDLYQRHYLEAHHAVLTAWWEQCLGLPEATWADRVRRIRPEQYEVLRAVVEEADLTALAEDALRRCQRTLPLRPEPEVYFLVGFFSPDGFTFEVEGRWSIGIGLERLTSSQLIPILLAHEYGHCYRRRLARPVRLGERLVEEGFAVELAARAFPERPAAEHFLMRPGQLAALQQYEDQLWRAIAPWLDSEDEALAARVLYGRLENDQWPSRVGAYLGWRLVSRFLSREVAGFDAPAKTVLQSATLTLAESRGGR